MYYAEQIKTFDDANALKARFDAESMIEAVLQNLLIPSESYHSCRS